MSDLWAPMPDDEFDAHGRMLVAMGADRRMWHEARAAREAAVTQAERIRVLEERLRGLTSWADNLLAEAEGQGGTYGFTRTGVRAAIADAQRALKEQP